MVLLTAAAAVVLELRIPLVLVAGVALAAWRLELGVLAWMALTAPLFVPVYRLEDSAVLFATAYLSALLALFAIDLALARRAWLRRTPLTAPLLTLAVVAVLSGVQGALFYDPSVPGVHRHVLVQIYGVGLVVLCAGAALLVADTLRTDTLLRWGYAIVIGVGVYITIALTIRSYRMPLESWSPMLMAEASALLYALVLHGLPRSFWARSAAAGLVLHAVYVIIVAQFLTTGGGQWISGWLSCGIALAVITVLRVPRLSAVLVPLGAAAGAWAFWPYVERVYTQAHDEGDFTRLVIWADAFRVAAMRPLLGVGPGNYIDYVERYASTLPYGSAHGNYQQVVAELGGLGLAALLWVVGATLYVGWRQYRRAAQPLYRALGLGAIGVLTGQAGASVLGDYLVPSYHNGGYATACTTLYVWMLIGLLAAGWDLNRGFTTKTPRHQENSNELTNSAGSA